MKALHTKKEVEHLLQRFMDGTSTLEEEAQLALYLRTHKVEGPWKAHQEMFQMFDQGEVEVRDTKQPPAIKSLKQLSAWWKHAGIAAAIALILFLGFFLLRNNTTEQPNLTAQADTVKTQPVEGSEPKDAREDKSDTTSAPKVLPPNLQRPPKVYMAQNIPNSITQAEDVSAAKETEETITVQEPATPEEAFTHPRIEETTDMSRSALVTYQDALFRSYEEMKREIRSRGERMTQHTDMVINDDPSY